MSNIFSPRLPPNELVPVPVGVAIDPIIAPFVTQQPLVQPAQGEQRTELKVTPREQPGAPPFQRAAAALGLQPPPQQRLDPNYQRNLTTLQNKYRDLAPLIGQLSPMVRDALIALDSRRVSVGSAPLTREQTVLAAQTAETGQQATPEPDRNPWNLPGNIVRDVGDIVRAIPRLPQAIINEVRDLPNMGTDIAEARAEGVNPISAMLQAPGIRMLPGAFVASELLEGDVAEVASRPVLSFLDVLPLASGAAATRPVAQAAHAERIAQAARLGRTRVPPRPISAVLTNRLDPATGALSRNRLGTLIDIVRQETPVGQAVDSAFGGTARAVSRMAGRREERIHALKLNIATPANVVEEFAPRLNDIFDRWSDEYPYLRHDAILPDDDALRADLISAMERDPSAFKPAFVNEMRDWLTDVGRYTSAQEWTGWFDNELYPFDIARDLSKREARAMQGDRITELRGEYLRPSGTVDVTWLRDKADDIDLITEPALKIEAARGLEAVLDAYSIDVAALRGKRRAITVDNYDAWRRQLDAVLNDPATVLTPRPSVTDITKVLRAAGHDRQATLLEQGILGGRLGAVSKALDNLASRVPPGVGPQFAAAARSAARRTAFEAKVGVRYSAKKVAQRWRTFQNAHKYAAPARFHGLLGDEAALRRPGALTKAAEAALARKLTPKEAAALVRAVEEKAWDSIPGIDEATVTKVLNEVEHDVLGTWRDLRAAGHDPLFVHRVGPDRLQGALHTRIGPVAQTITQAKERVLDLTPRVNDLQVAMTHQAAELVGRHHSEQFIIEVMDAVGVPLSELRRRFTPEATRRAAQSRRMDTEGWLKKILDDTYVRFNPDVDGYSWGGRALDKYRNDAIFIPKAIATNLKSYIGPKHNLFTAISDPITGLFRYQVIGLSAGIIVNNFFSNAVAMTAESGLRPWKFWSTAREWLNDPRKIPLEELRALTQREQPHMGHLGADRWLNTRLGLKFQMGLNAGTAFADSAAWQAIKAGKRGLDGVVEKSLQMQRWGDNVFRVMQYLDELEKGQLKGAARAEAENSAMELVRQTFVSYADHTPIERGAIRTIIPFYSYMGHAARMLLRYPLNHPLRASLAAHLAEAEKERLGALPGSFLSLLPIPGMGMDPSTGDQTFLNAQRLLNPFDDQADLMTVAGWLSATNPVIQTALRSVGVIRGESEIYPTLRYDPETGRMKAVHPSFLESLIASAFPRLGAPLALAGLNPIYNELAARDPGAARRSLLAQAGIPRVWREHNIPTEQIQGELRRQQSANDVLNEAMRSGDWSEALRYPSLRPYYDQLATLTPDQIAAMQPASQEDIAAALSQVGP